MRTRIVRTLLVCSLSLCCGCFLYTSIVTIFVPSPSGPIYNIKALEDSPGGPITLVSTAGNFVEGRDLRGNLRWRHSHVAEAYVGSLFVSNDNSIYAAGGEEDSFSHDHALIFEKLTSTGTPVWSNRLHPTPPGAPEEGEGSFRIVLATVTSISQGLEGGIVASAVVRRIGISPGEGEGEGEGEGGAEVPEVNIGLALAMDRDGAVLWEFRQEKVSLLHAALAPNGTVLVFGFGMDFLLHSYVLDEAGRLESELVFPEIGEVSFDGGGYGVFISPLQRPKAIETPEGIVCFQPLMGGADIYLIQVDWDGVATVLFEEDVSPIPERERWREHVFSFTKVSNGYLFAGRRHERVPLGLALLNFVFESDYGMALNHLFRRNGLVTYTIVDNGSILRHAYNNKNTFEHCLVLPDGRRLFVGSESRLGHYGQVYFYTNEQGVPVPP